MYSCATPILQPVVSSGCVLPPLPCAVPQCYQQPCQAQPCASAACPAPYDDVSISIVNPRDRARVSPNLCLTVALSYAAGSSSSVAATLGCDYYYSVWVGGDLLVPESVSYDLQLQLQPGQQVIQVTLFRRQLCSGSSRAISSDSACVTVNDCEIVCQCPVQELSCDLAVPCQKKTCVQLVADAANEQSVFFFPRHTSAVPGEATVVVFDSGNESDASILLLPQLAPLSGCQDAELAAANYVRFGTKVSFKNIGIGAAMLRPADGNAIRGVNADYSLLPGESVDLIGTQGIWWVL